MYAQVMIVDEVATVKDMRALSKAKDRGTTIIAGARVDSLTDLKSSSVFSAALQHRTTAPMQDPK